MADIKFGVNQIGEKTPKFISALKRALNFFSGSVVVFLPQIATFTHTTIDTLTTIMGLFILVVNTVGIMFGADPDTKP